MSSDFYKNFIAGWQMGQDRTESQRRDEMMARQAEQEAYRRQQEQINNAMRQEEWKLRKQEADLNLKKTQFDAKAQAAAMTSRNQEVLPPETQDLGGATPAAPSAGVLNLGALVQQRAPITAEIPGAPPEIPPVQLPFREDIQAQKEAESQRKMREALGMFTAQEGIKAQFRPPEKSLAQIEAEAAARTRGTLKAGGLAGDAGGDQSLDAVAAGVANYELGLSDLGRMPQGAKALVFAKAKQIDPNFNASLYQSRQKLRADFTSGKTSGNIDSLNTAVAHIGALKEFGDAMNNGNVQLANQIGNSFATATGNPAPTNFQTMATAVESEVASLLKKAGATDQEINSWRANFSKNMSPAQIQGAISTTLDVMRGRERALQQRWKTGMGAKDDYPIYGEEQQQILSRLGYGGGSAAGPDEGWQTVAGVRVRRVR